MKKKNKIVDIFVSAVVTCMGLGYFPKGSGTVASFFALGFWSLFLMFEARLALVLICLILMVLGTLAIQAYEKRTRTEDSSKIVIDEWVGMGLSLALCPFKPGWLLLAFCLFRVFDIFKPPGVRFFDQRHLKGWGVMLDDVVAGIYAALIIEGLKYWVL